MNFTRQAFQLMLSAILAVVFCCQCETTEEPDVLTSLEGGSKFGKFGKVSKVGMKRESGYKFADSDSKKIEKSEAAQRVANTLNNEKVIKNSKGEVVRKEQRSDLYSDMMSNTAKESGKSFDRKMARIKDSKFGEKEFKTPEYLKRQEFAGYETTDGGAQMARETDSLSNQFTKMFKAKQSSMENQMARESGSTKGRFDKIFGTRDDSISNKAIKTSVVPVGVDGMTGYRENVAMSMDDVKKLVN
ncbi:MAG: hypothetical protein P1V20_17300 [Verrucomicrobiales bacterium]|nr:hypothetical protein [Verrucomicrobiales bacterium]